MLGTLLDLLAGVVVFLSLLWFGWLGVGGLISPRLVGGRSRLGLLCCGAFGCAVSLYLMDALMAQGSEPEPAPVAVRAPAPPPAPDPPPDPPDPPDTTWIIESRVVAAAGDRELLRIAVTCRGDNWLVVVGAVDEDADDLVRARWSWDGERPVDYGLLTRYAAGQYTLTTSQDVIRAARIVQQLRTRTVLELRTRARVDLFGLAEAPAALDSISCETAEPLPPPRPEVTYSMDTEAGIVANLMQSSIGSTVQVVLRLMAGYDPVASREGEDRLFTYRFDDGSVLVLVFRPLGGPGTGLVFDDIIVR